MRRTITDGEKMKARELYMSGMTYAEITRQLKRDPVTVEKISKACLLKPLLKTFVDLDRSIRPVKTCDDSPGLQGVKQRQVRRSVWHLRLVPSDVG